MKKVLLIIILASALFGCKSPEDKAVEVVDEFLAIINDRTREPNKQLITENYDKFFSDKSYYSSKDWDLSAKRENDTTIVVLSKAQTYNGLGQPIEIVQSFSLTDRLGGWKIWETYNLVVSDLDFELVDTQWDFLWDRQKAYVLEHLQENLKLEVITPGYIAWGATAGGKLRLINNSDYDIKGIKILIEHFDRNGVSVNTDREFVRDYVRKGGYREFDWLTTDCASCYSQTYKINFIKESY